MNETRDSSKDLSILTEAESDDFLLPTPLAVAGVGLLLGAIFPGGMTGGQGFLFGLGFGFLLSVVMPMLTVRDDTTSARCPTCGARLIRSKGVVGSIHNDMNSLRPKGTENGR